MLCGRQIGGVYALDGLRSVIKGRETFLDDLLLIETIDLGQLERNLLPFIFLC